VTLHLSAVLLALLVAVVPVASQLPADVFLRFKPNAWIEPPRSRIIDSNASAIVLTANVSMPVVVQLAYKRL